LPLKGNVPLSELADVGISDEMSLALEGAPSNSCTSWGIPFEIGDVVALNHQIVSFNLNEAVAEWLVFMHTSDLRPIDHDSGGLISPMRGEGQLAEHAADYVMVYSDGTEERVAILRRHQIGMFQRLWGENCFGAVPHNKPYPRRAANEQPTAKWGVSQTRVMQPDGGLGSGGLWINWLWAWKNPHPEKIIVGIRFEPVTGLVVLSAISAGDASSLPLRWRTRRKACLTLPQGDAFVPELDESGLLQQIQLDMGQVVSATPRLIYPNDTWSETYNNQIPEMSENEVLIEYSAHPDANFHLSNGQTIPVSQVESSRATTSLELVPPATQRVTLRTVEYGSDKQVPVKLHIHGNQGEYLAPVDRHRIINPAWFEDYSVDYIHPEQLRSGGGPLPKPVPAHSCTYIPGETTIDLPLGTVYVEVSKGFEIRPVRKVIEVSPSTREIVIEIERVLPWREVGWVTADTHVHFLSPMSALLEGSAEGVNVVNLLAS
jgi:hypothetical protein